MRMRTEALMKKNKYINKNSDCFGVGDENFNEVKLQYDDNDAVLLVTEQANTKCGSHASQTGLKSGQLKAPKGGEISSN